MGHLQEIFKRFCQSTTIDFTKKSVVVGFSGGADSVALSHFLNAQGVKIILAHVNYQLRGKDSLDDEAFCKAFAEKLNLPFHSIRVDVPADVNMEEFARNARYAFFNELSGKYADCFIALGHHANDQAETILYKLAKGTGIRGLRGMKPVSENVIRPFLEATKSEILDYCQHNGLKFRDDLSNKNEDFSRNKIRHSIVPVIETLNPSFVKTVSSHARDLQEMEDWVNAKLNEDKSRLVSEKAGVTSIDYSKAMEFDGGSFFVREVFSDFGISGPGFKDFLTNPKTGDTFEMNGFAVLYDRGFLRVQKKEDSIGSKILIEEKENSTLKFEEFPNGITSLKSNQEEILVEASKLKFPLQIRSWEDGDWFIPFGMSGKKKVSDFLIDQKVSRFEKENIKVLENGNGDILWVIGKRGDNRYKVNDQTTEIYKLALK